MQPIPANELLAGLTLAEPISIRAVVTDSRKVEPDCVFVCFPGERVDGHTFAAGVNQIAAQLKPEGMRLLYHPHALESYSLGGGRKGLDILIEETDPDGLHFALDTHWLQSAGLNPPDQIRRVKGRMHIVHYKDYKIIGGAVKIEDVVKMFGEVGEGNLDWPAIIQASRDIGVEYAIVEQDICPGDPFASLQISFENLVKFGV